MRTMPIMIQRYCGCYSRCRSFRRSSTLAVRSFFFLVTLLLFRHDEHWRGMEMLRAVYVVNGRKLLQTSTFEGCGLCVPWGRRRPPSHGPVFLPRLVGRRASGCAQGGRQGAEEARQQGETQAPPGTKHGPAVAVANVLGKAVHVAGVAGQLEVDSCHARAQGDDTACSCVSRKTGGGGVVKKAPILHQICRTGVTLLRDIDLSITACPLMSLNKQPNWK